MDNTINIRELLEQTRDDAETTIKEGAARTVKLDDLIAAIGWAVEAYIQLVYISERHLPDLDKRRAVTLVISGILMGVGGPEAFGLKRDDMFDIANSIYDMSLSECGFGAGDPGEGAI